MRLKHLQYVNRELEIMQLLAEKRHCNVIALKHYEVQETVCFFVMEKYTCSLADLIGEWTRRRQGSPWKTELYTYQLARGFAHIHGMGIYPLPRAVRVTRPLIPTPFSSAAQFPRV